MTEYITAILAITRLEFNSGAMAPRKDIPEYNFRNNAQNEQFKPANVSSPLRQARSKKESIATQN